MPLVTDKQNPIDLTPKVTPDQTRYQTQQADDSNVPLTTIAPYISGFSWIVDYYSQVLGPDDPVQEHSINLNPVNQAYKKIENMELKVQSEIDFNFNKAQITEELTGSAVIYSGSIEPNRYDLFLADVGLSRPAVFVVRDVNKMSHLAETAYEIEYQSVDLLNDQVKQDLENKIVDTGFFSVDYLLDGKDPVLMGSEVQQIIKLQEAAADLMAMYCDEFINRTLRFLLLPENQYATYDPYVHEFLMDVFEVSTIPRLRDLNEPNFRNDPELDIATVWDLIKGSSLRLIKEKLKPADTIVLRTQRALGNIYHTNLYRFMCPVDSKYAPSYTIRREVKDELYPYDSVTEVRSPIYNVDKDDYYVFSESFYTDNFDSMSELEHLTKRFMNNDPMDPVEVLSLLDTYRDWYPLERFYYTPIVLVLIQYVLRG